MFNWFKRDIIIFQCDFPYICLYLYKLKIKFFADNPIIHVKTLKVIKRPQDYNIPYKLTLPKSALNFPLISCLCLLLWLTRMLMIAFSSAPKLENMSSKYKTYFKL